MPWSPPSHHLTPLPLSLDLLSLPLLLVCICCPLVCWQCYGPGGHVSRPSGSVVASYLRHINPFTRFHERPVQYFVKMFVRAHACADLRVHGCARAGNGTAPAMTPLGVRGAVPWASHADVHAHLQDMNVHT